MQMTFMIVAVFFFFILVGLFFLGFTLQDVRNDAVQMERLQAISSLGVIADMSELNFDSGTPFTLDEDKLKIMISNFSGDYDNFWPVASVSVLKLWPDCFEDIVCSIMYRSNHHIH